MGGGIGCHGMVLMMDPERVGTITGITQMGGEGAQWIGIEPFVGTDHFIQNLGDGTYFHSGSLAIRAAVAAGSHVTYKILYNSAVAMTGGQDAPGAQAVPELAASLRLEGVSPGHHHDRRGRPLPGRQAAGRASRSGAGSGSSRRRRSCARSTGVTVLIHDQQCAAEKRRDRKRGRVDEPPMRIVINERVCEGCGDCGVASNCLSVQPVETEFGRKTRIHQSSCNKDYSCLAGDCPSFLTVVPRRRAAGSCAGALRRRWPAPPGGRATAGDRQRRPGPARGRRPAAARARRGRAAGAGAARAGRRLHRPPARHRRNRRGDRQPGARDRRHARRPLRLGPRPDRPVPEGGPGRVGPADQPGAAGGDQQGDRRQRRRLPGVGPAGGARARPTWSARPPSRTVAVASTSPTPTGRDGRRHPRRLPVDRLACGPSSTRPPGPPTTSTSTRPRSPRASSATRPPPTRSCSGAAYQLGLLPISAAAIEQAIDLNGAAVEINQLAFRWGRMLVSDPARVGAAMVGPAAPAPEPVAADLALIGELDEGELGRLLRIRVPDLVAYQGRSLARRYVGDRPHGGRGGAARRRRARPRWPRPSPATSTSSWPTRTSTRWPGCTSTPPPGRAGGGRRSASDVKVSYNLHPPLLRALGLDHKLRLGPWFTPVLGGLARGKRLRGTPLDPFGYAKVRRVERRLAREYRRLVERLADRLTPANLEQAVALAELPDEVRGYEHVKLANVERYRAELGRLRDELGV